MDNWWYEFNLKYYDNDPDVNKFQAARGYAFGSYHDVIDQLADYYGKNSLDTIELRPVDIMNGDIPFLIASDTREDAEDFPWSGDYSKYLDEVLA